MDKISTTTLLLDATKAYQYVANDSLTQLGNGESYLTEITRKVAEFYQNGVADDRLGFKNYPYDPNDASKPGLTYAGAIKILQETHDGTLTDPTKTIWLMDDFLPATDSLGTENVPFSGQYQNRNLNLPQAMAILDLSLNHNKNLPGDYRI